MKFRSKYFYLTLIYIIIIGCGTILCMYPPNGITLFMICGDMCLVVCLLLPESRIIEISQEGCNVRLLFLKKDTGGRISLLYAMVKLNAQSR